MQNDPMDGGNTPSEPPKPDVRGIRSSLYIENVKTWAVWGGLGLVTAIVIGVIWQLVAGGDDGSELPTTTASSTATAPTASTQTGEGRTAYADQVQNAILDGLMTSDHQRPTTFADMCETTPPVTWACAIARIEPKSSGSVKVILRPEEVWIESWDGSLDWYDFGEYVARSVYNFAHASGVTSLSEIDVYEPDGGIAYLSPPGWRPGN